MQPSLSVTLSFVQVRNNSNGSSNGSNRTWISCRINLLLVVHLYSLFSASVFSSLCCSSFWHHIAKTYIYRQSILLFPPRLPKHFITIQTVFICIITATSTLVHPLNVLLFFFYRSFHCQRKHIWSEIFVSLPVKETDIISLQSSSQHLRWMRDM